MVKKMKPGSVIVDVSVDQGDCIETIHSTTHSAPTYVEEGVLHYAVANIPGAVPWTSTRADDQRHDALCSEARQIRLPSCFG